MKMNKYIISGLLLAWLGFSCEDKWDDHYSQKSVISGGEAAVVNKTVIDYLKSESSLSKMYQLFDKTGVARELATKEQLFTVLVASDEALGTVAESDTLLARMHVCGVSLAPSELPDGQRLLMWNGKYVNTSIVTETTDEGEKQSIYLGGMKVKRVVKTTNAFVYELEHPLKAQLSVYEYLTKLGDEYSLFKQMVLTQSERKFDIENSSPLGVDETGNTIYDSVWFVSNPFFNPTIDESAQKVNIASEFRSSTMLLPTNEVLKECLHNGYLTISNALGRTVTAEDTAKLETWVIQSLFYNKFISPEDYQLTEDLTSAYGQQWRTSVQQVNTGAPVVLSNGIAYNVNTMKIPNNILVYRIKQFFRYYENCTESEKAEYFKFTNYNDTIAQPVKVEKQSDDFSPLPGVWPTVTYYTVIVEPFTNFSFEFTGLILNGKQVEKALIPSGEYTLCMGFKERLNFKINVFVNDVLINKNPISLTKNTFHFDRGTGGYPEGFDPKAPGLIGKPAAYDRDGGTIGTVNFTGTGMSPIVIRIATVDAVPAGAKFHGFHWCLKPTENNY